MAKTLNLSRQSTPIPDDRFPGRARGTIVTEAYLRPSRMGDSTRERRHRRRQAGEPLSCLSGSGQRARRSPAFQADAAIGLAGGVRAALFYGSDESDQSTALLPLIASREYGWRRPHHRSR
jgi:hypothetical protein